MSIPFSIFACHPCAGAMHRLSLERERERERSFIDNQERERGREKVRAHNLKEVLGAHFRLASH
jgi:hypothetical protein